MGLSLNFSNPGIFHCNEFFELRPLSGKYFQNIVRLAEKSVFYQDLIRIGKMSDEIKKKKERESLCSKEPSSKTSFEIPRKGQQTKK